MRINVTTDTGTTNVYEAYNSEDTSTLLLGEIANALWSISRKLGSGIEVVPDDSAMVGQLQSIAQSLSDALPQ